MKENTYALLLSLAALTSFTSIATAQPYLDPVEYASPTYQTEFSDLTAAVNTPGNLNFTAQGGLASGFDYASNLVGSNQLVLGGVYDIIFIGEHAGWTGNDLDILFYNDAAGTSPISGSAVENVFENIEAPDNTVVGSFRQLAVGADLAGKYYDFVLDSASSSADNGGRWSLFYPDNNNPTSDYDYAFAKTISSTTVFAFEDWNQNSSSGSNAYPVKAAPDFDRNDFVFGFNHTNANVIPEPSTYAIMIGSLCLGFVAWKRRRMRNRD